MAWLNEKEEGSVVYICFGSMMALSLVQTDVVATALEQSGAWFVWCMRAEAVGPSAEFEKRIKGKGVVIKGWVPQVEVLGHVSVGWFLTHCGWNSVLEGITAGVGMLTWPMGGGSVLQCEGRGGEGGDTGEGVHRARDCSRTE